LGLTWDGYVSGLRLPRLEPGGINIIDRRAKTGNWELKKFEGY
jgi:hypothetical protein